MKPQVGPVVVPTRPEQTVQKGYLDTVSRGSVAYAGWVLTPQWILNGSANTINNGRGYLTPIDLAVPGATYDLLRINVNTAQAGGTSNGYLCLYPPTSENLPDTTNTLASGTFSALSAGDKDVSLGANPIPLIGRYWLFFLHVVSGTLSTAAKFTTIINSTFPLGLPPGISLTAPVRAITRPNITAPPTDATTGSNTGVSGGVDSPIVGIRRAA